MGRGHLLVHVSWDDEPFIERGPLTRPAGTLSPAGERDGVRGRLSRFMEREHLLAHVSWNDEPRTVGRDSVEPAFERSERLPTRGSSRARAHGARAWPRNDQGSTESRPTAG